MGPHQASRLGRCGRFHLGRACADVVLVRRRIRVVLVDSRTACLFVLVALIVEFAIGVDVAFFRRGRGEIGRLDLGVPLLTNAQAAILFIDSIHDLSQDDLAIRNYDEYFHDGLTPEETRQLFLLK